MNKTGKGVAAICPDCGGDRKCALCCGFGTIAPSLRDKRLAVVSRNLHLDAEVSRLRAINAELLAFVKRAIEDELVNDWIGDEARVLIARAKEVS